MSDGTSDPVRVESGAGIEIAVWCSGGGDPIVLVHGTTSDHATFDELVPHLESRRRVTRFDRRGRGQSGDGDGAYEIEAEFADARAVIAHAAAEAGRPVDVFAHSFGAWIAIGASVDNPDVRRLVLYSPGFGARYPEGSLDRIEAATQRDGRDQALQLLMKEVIGMPDADIQFMRRSAVWQRRLDSAPTIARECRADEEFLARRGELLRDLRVPTLVVDGAANVPEKRDVGRSTAALIPQATLTLLDGEGHAAHHTAPAALAGVTLDWLEA